MTEVISVQFSDNGRNYYFNPKGRKYSVGELAVVNTANGISAGTVSEGNHMVEDGEIKGQLQNVLRPANEKDTARLRENGELERKAVPVCEEYAARLGLEMKIIRAEYSFERDKLTFFFTADGRVDFRELVKQLAAKFHTRIELRQVGVRDEARMLGGLGICGQPYCCRRFLDSFVPVSIKMAKVQGLSLNPSKISGSCGRLMCCLKYEQDAYEYLNSLTPRVGETVVTPQGSGTVTDANPISGWVYVKTGEENAVPVKFRRDEVIRSGDRKCAARPDKRESAAENGDFSESDTADFGEKTGARSEKPRRREKGRNQRRPKKTSGGDNAE